MTRKRHRAHHDEECNGGRHRRYLWRRSQAPLTCLVACTSVRRSPRSVPINVACTCANLQEDAVNNNNSKQRVCARQPRIR